MKTLLTTLAAAMALAILPGRGDAQGVAAVAEGAKLYGQNCVRCHSARSPMERTDREWVTIVNHMRARANLTRSQARALAVFLQQTNAPEGASPRGVPAPASPDPAPAADPDEGAGPPEAGEEDGQDPPLLVLVDLADPEMTPETRLAVRRYLKRIR